MTQNLIPAPFFGEFDCGPWKLPGKFIELLFEEFEKRQGIGR